MTEPSSHLPPLLRAAMLRRPRRYCAAWGEGDTPPPQNNYVAVVPKNPIGARPGNRNAVTHGRFSAESRARRAALATRLRDLRARLAAAMAQAEMSLRQGRDSSDV